MAPPPAAPNKKRRQRMILIGAAGAALLLLLYLRSRSSSGASPNATSSTDLQGAYSQGAQQQAQQDALSSGGAAGGGLPSTFADNGANAAALGDAVTNALAQFESTPPSWYTPPTPPDSAGMAPATVPGAAAVTINVNSTGPHTAKPGTGTKSASNTQRTATVKPGTRLAGGAIEARSGAHSPPPKAGYTTVGVGGGRWVYKPKPNLRHTGSTSHHNHNKKTRKRR